jgi:uncharacterized protein (DUF302 family)
MKTNNITLVIPADFDTLLQAAREAILNNGFLLLHEINPQAILGSQGIVTGKIRQLLFFHPAYMKQLLDTAPAAVIEVPLKLVLQEVADRETMLSYFDPALHLQGYAGLEDLQEVLQVKVSTIIAALHKSK